MSTAVPVSDLQLQSLAEEPTQDLFPILNSSLAFAPWVVVLAFLPPLAGAFYWTLDERSAEWGLRALNSSTFHPDPEAIWRGEIEEPRLTGAPPLCTWLTRILLSYGRIPLPLGLTGVSYLAVAVTILFAARLSRRLGVSRLASLTVLCCAGSPLLLNSAHAAGPEALGLCFMTVSLERFLAHLDASVGRWSGRLLASALAWGGCWLAIGWPALCLGLALTLHAVIFPAGPFPAAVVAEFPAVGRTPMQVYRRSLVPWWIVGILTGTWWMGAVIGKFGFASTLAWLFDPTPNAISPLFPDTAAIVSWGASIGLMFLTGWIVIGFSAILLNPPKVLGAATEGRGVLILTWWIALFLCRTVTAAGGFDPTLWDVLQTVPACLTAAMGMELVMQRSVSMAALMFGVAIGLFSLAVHVSRVETPSLQTALTLGTLALVVPVLVNLLQVRSLHWPESAKRRALRGLLVSTWLAQLVWGVSQSLPASRVQMQFARQLKETKVALPEPGAIIVVSQTVPSRALEFQLRRTWPQASFVVADRWESAVSKLLPAIDHGGDAEFLVVELAYRDSPFRRAGTGWIVTTLGEPRRYFGEQLTLHRVSSPSP